MRLVAIVLAGAVATTAARSVPPLQQSIDNVAAFARLYGVVRYFYPGDAAAALDWDRFAVYGVDRVRRATDLAELEAALDALFAPLGPGISIGTGLPSPPRPGERDPKLVGWQYLGPGKADTPGDVYTAGRTNRSPPPDPDLFVSMLQRVAAGEYRGRRLRLTGRISLRAAPEALGWTGLWLRETFPSRQSSLTDVVADPVIESTEWGEYTVEKDIADNAAFVYFGPIATGDAAADFDALQLSVLVDGAWAPIAILNGGFEEAGTLSWNRLGTAAAARVSFEETDSPEGRRHLRLVSSAILPAPEGAPETNAHADIELGSGLRARVRLSLSDVEAGTPGPGLDHLKRAIASLEDPSDRFDPEVRVADVVVAWNVLRHFYPYWEEAGVDWDSRLRPQLTVASAAEDRQTHHRALRLLVADARDGHGNVSGDWPAGQRFALAFADGQVVVSATSAPDEMPIGSIVTEIGERPSVDLLEEWTRQYSGTSQWRRSRALTRIARCVPGTTIAVGLRLPDEAVRGANLPCVLPPQMTTVRPEPITEIEGGMWYVDLTRANGATITPILPTLAAAEGIVFDLRGYPTDAGRLILRHLIDAPESARWMHVPHITGPFGQVEGWQSYGWDLTPASPHLAAPRVFLTSGQAISYGESVMGYVDDLDLATIVGSPTAGTNGNVAVVELPSGLSIAFTGMRVTRHDGQTPFHLEGVVPDIVVEPTLDGLRTGRDEVLERALEVLRAR